MNRLKVPSYQLVPSKKLTIPILNLLNVKWTCSSTHLIVIIITVLVLTPFNYSNKLKDASYIHTKMATKYVQQIFLSSPISLHFFLPHFHQVCMREIAAVSAKILVFLFSFFFLFHDFWKLAANWQLVTHKNHCMEVNENWLAKNGAF